MIGCAPTVSGTDPEKDAPDRRRIKQMEVMVAEAVQETADTTTLVFFTGNDRLDYKAGHFLTIDPHQFEGLERFIAFLEDLKGRKEPPRAYSMASSPHEKYLAVTVKEERYVTGLTQYPPLLSPPAREAHPARDAARGDRVHGAVHTARGHRVEEPTTSCTSARAPAASPTSRS
jgi:hypothetical protein